MLTKKTISGLVNDSLIFESDSDYFGGQITDIRYYDAQGGLIKPSSGEIKIQASPNKRDWVSFIGGDRVFCNLPINDIQYGGFIDAIRVLPDAIADAVSYAVDIRLHGVGMPSAPSTSYGSTPYFNGLITASFDPFSFVAFQGNAYSCSIPISLIPGEKISARVVKNSNAVITFTRAPGFFIEYYTGDVSGDLFDLAGGESLNQTIKTDFQVAFEFYDGRPSGQRIISNVGELQEPLILNGGGSMEISNLSGDAITSFISIGISGLPPATTPYMLIANQQIEPTTEMSTFNA